MYAYRSGVANLLLDIPLAVLMVASIVLVLVNMRYRPRIAARPRSAMAAGLGHFAAVYGFIVTPKPNFSPHAFFVQR